MMRAQFVNVKAFIMLEVYCSKYCNPKKDREILTFVFSPSFQKSILGPSLNLVLICFTYFFNCFYNVQFYEMISIGSNCFVSITEQVLFMCKHGITIFDNGTK